MNSKLKCVLCNSLLIVSSKHKIGYPVYKCIRCDQLFYVGDNKSKIIYKNGIKYINLNS